MFNTTDVCAMMQYGADPRLPAEASLDDGGGGDDDDTPQAGRQRKQHEAEEAQHCQAAEEEVLLTLASKDLDETSTVR